MPTPPHADRVVRTVCSPNCSGTCGINVHVRDERILKIEPGEFPDSRFKRICLKGISMAMQRVHHPDRLTHPLKRVGARGEGRFERISWDEAFDLLARELTRIRREHGPQANAWTTMTGNYGVRATTAPNRIANCLGGTWFTYLGLMGDAGCSMGHIPTLGVFNTSNEWSDLKGAKLVLLFARNLADTGHSEMHFLFDAMEAGAKLVVIDPRYSRTAAKADQWIAPRPGTDTALLLAMCHEIVKRGLADEAFLRAHTNAPFVVRMDTRALLRAGDVAGLEDAPADAFVVCTKDANGHSTLQSALRPRASGDDVSKSSDSVPRRPRASADPIEGSTTTEEGDFAGDSAVLRPAPFLHTHLRVKLRDGSEVDCRTAYDAMLEAWEPWSPEHAAEVCEVPAEIIRALAIEYATNAPAAVWLGQGMQRYFDGHLAFRAAITLGALCGNIGRRHAGVNWSDGALFRLLFSLPPEWVSPGGKRGRELPGTRMLDTIAHADPYPIKSLWLAGYGFGTQSPNFDRFVREALPQLDLFVITEQVMTPAAQYADLVLPCVSYYEDDFDLVPSAENLYLQLRRRAIEPVGESKDDYAIFKGVCERMGQGADWQMSAEEIARYMIENATDPSVRGVDWEELKRTGVVRLALPEPHVPFADRKFPTPSGRIELYTESLRAFGQEVAVYSEPLESNRRPGAARYPLTLMTSHPMHTVHSQHTNLPWIRELVAGPRLEMHPRDATRRDLHDGDLVTVYNDRGRFRVKLLITEAVQPGSLNLPQGWWPKHLPDGHYQNVAHLTPNPAQDAIIETNYAVFDNLVEVE